LLQTRPLLRLRLRNSSQEKLPPPIIPRANSAQKFLLLVRRNFRLLWRDKTVYPMLVIPPLIALLDFFFTSGARVDPGRAPVLFGVLVFLALLIPGLLVQNEIFKERRIYQYENRTKTLLFPYVLSKVWMVGMFAIYQALVWTVMHFLAIGMIMNIPVLLSFGITIFLIAFLGGILGLLVSALSRRAMTTTNWLLFFTIPQLLLSGAILPVVNLGFPSNLLSRINPARYALEALLATNGYGEGLNVSPLGDWIVLAILSLGFIFFLLGVQRAVGSVRT
jgi:ABC-type multidrug transport system permease subunit